MRRYRSDQAGNLLELTTTTDSRTTNDLRDDIWLFSYSDSGPWDPVAARLLRVQGPGGVDIEHR